MITFDKEIGFIESGQMVTVVVTRVKFDSEKYDSQGRRTQLLVQHVNVSHKADDIRVSPILVTSFRLFQDGSFYSRKSGRM